MNVPPDARTDVRGFSWPLQMAKCLCASGTSGCFCTLYILFFPVSPFAATFSSCSNIWNIASLTQPLFKLFVSLFACHQCQYNICHAVKGKCVHVTCVAKHVCDTYTDICVCVCVHACLTVTNTDTSSLFLPLVRFLLVGLKSFNSFRNCGILSFIGFFSRFLLGALESGTLV